MSLTTQFYKYIYIYIKMVYSTNNYNMYKCQNRE